MASILLLFIAAAAPPSTEKKKGKIKIVIEVCLFSSEWLYITWVSFGTDILIFKVFSILSSLSLFYTFVSVCLFVSISLSVCLPVPPISPSLSNSQNDKQTTSNKDPILGTSYSLFSCGIWRFLFSVHMCLC